MLEKVKTGLSITGTASDANIRLKIIAVKGFMLNAGITIEQIESDLGVVTLTIGVSDLWNVNSGEVDFSNAFKTILIPQLQAVSLEG
ncbi:hypothetical protein DFP95_12148 [Cohnella lupini]|uniref:Uncharacterized protein n=1 Tax=Cohnella lupini TaxID=1294267 RepID=A0A3D9HZ46_9BACL|nr:hypothetical protein DFP95_12148 [Cohnella lupini]